MKRTPKESLKGLSITYIILAVILLIFGIVVNFIPGLEDVLKQDARENALLQFEVTIIVNILIYVWYFWLARRVVDGKSNGTLYMVLLMIGVIGAIISAFMGSTRAISSLDFIVNAVALYFLLKIRKEDVQ